jgi:hypothetical protein
MNGTAWVSAALALTLGFSRPAWADTPSSGPNPNLEDTAPVSVDEAPPAERPFLFTPDPSLAAPLHVIVSAGMGNVTRTGEERPVGAGDIIPTLGAELGVLPRLSFYVDTGAVFWSAGTRYVSPVTLQAGGRILLTNPHNASFLLTLQPSYGLDFYGNNTALLNVAFAWNTELVRVAASGTVSHTFQSDADPVDVEASLGAALTIPLGFRVGLEGVVTDLEEIADAEAEGGSSAYAGPTVGWEWEHRFQIVAGPAYGVGPNYSGFMGRVAASAQF